MFLRAFRRIPWGYTARRLLIAIPTLLAIISVAFLMMRAAPGGPFDGERKLPPATERAIAEKFGLDKPLHEQYLDYVGGVLQGDFGPSYKTLGKSVNDLIADGLGNKEIAARLDLSVRTVESHRINIKRKFELDSSAALMKFAMERRRDRG